MEDKTDLMSLIGPNVYPFFTLNYDCSPLFIFCLVCFSQHALRLQAFRQLHKVLGIDPLPPPSKFRRFGRRFKRGREDSGQGEEGAKKEKKEGEGERTGDSMEVSSGARSEVKTDAKA